MRYLLRRLLHAVFVLAGVSVLSFLFSEMAPGDYFAEMRMMPQVSADTIAAQRAQYGLDRPLPIRYARWLQSVARGDFGYSFAYNAPARKLLGVRARNTLLLTGTAIHGIPRRAFDFHFENRLYRRSVVNGDIYSRIRRPGEKPAQRGRGL